MQGSEQTGHVCVADIRVRYNTTLITIRPHNSKHMLTNTSSPPNKSTPHSWPQAKLPSTVGSGYNQNMPGMFNAQFRP